MGSSSSHSGPLQRGISFRSVKLVSRRLLLASPPATHAVYELDFELAHNCTAAQLYGQPTTHVKVRIPGKRRGRTYSIMAAEPALRQNGGVYSLNSANESDSAQLNGMSDATQPLATKPNLIRLVVKHYPGGVMSTYLTQKVEIGQPVEMSLTRTKQIRKFLFKSPSSTATATTTPVLIHLGIILFGVAADEAVNCLAGLLYKNANKGLRVTMILANKTKDDILFADEWRALLNRYGGPGEARALRIVHVLSRSSSSSSSQSSESSAASDAISGLSEVICGHRVDGDLLKRIFLQSESSESSSSSVNGGVLNWPVPSVFFIVGSKPMMKSTWKLVKLHVNSKAKNMLQMSLAGSCWFLGCTPSVDAEE